MFIHVKPFNKMFSMSFQARYVESRYHLFMTKELNDEQYIEQI